MQEQTVSDKTQSILEIKEDGNNYLDLESGLPNLYMKNECQLLHIFKKKS